MSFVLSPIDQIKVDVKIEVPGDMGKVQRQSVIVTYRKRTVTEQKELVELLKEVADDVAVGSVPSLSDEDVMREDIINIEGIMDTERNKIEYTQDLLVQLLDIDYVHRALFKSWSELNFGVDLAAELRRKNSN